MRILITGGAGFIGTALCGRLIEDGHRITVLDNLMAALPFPNLPRVEAIKGDVSDRLAWGGLGPQYDVVFHLAASFANERSLDYTDEDAQTNILGTINAAQFAHAIGARLIYAGSSSSYGETQFYDARQQQPIPFAEEMPCNPHTPYGLSKLVGERYAQLLCPNSVVLRLFNVFGPGDPPTAYRNAIPKMIRSALTHGNVEVMGYDSTRDFMHIDTLVDIMVQLLWRGDMAGTFNVCTGRETLLLEVGNLIAEHFGVPCMIRPRREWDKVSRRVGDATHIAACFPEVLDAPSVPDRLGETITYVRNWMQENGHAAA